LTEDPGRAAVARVFYRCRDVYIEAADWLSRATGLVAAILLLAAILVICDMIVMRYFLHESTYWQTETAIYAVLGATLIGSPYVLLVGGHVSVTLAAEAAGGARGRFINLLGQIAGFGFCALLAYSGWYYFLDAYTHGWTSDTIWAVHMWIPVSALPIGLTVLALQYVAEILRPKGP
jgi:TRAP-type C4-dicarboxylate transport system permease small subunit